MPAAFQNTEVASSAIATYAPPMPAPRAPTLIFRNWPPNVPTFSKMSACASPGTSNAASPASAISLFTIVPPYAPRSTDDDKLAALDATLGRDREQVDPAHHVLAVARNEIPAGLPIAARVLLLRDVRVRLTVAVDHGRAARRGVHGVVPVERIHEVAGERVDLDRPLPVRQPVEVDVRARGVGRVRREIPRRGPLLDVPHPAIGIRDHPHLVLRVRRGLRRHALGLGRRAAAVQLHLALALTGRVERGHRVEVEEAVLHLVVDEAIAADRVTDTAFLRRARAEHQRRVDHAVRVADAEYARVRMDDVPALQVPEVAAREADLHRVVLLRDVHGRADRHAVHDPLVVSLVVEQP